MADKDRLIRCSDPADPKRCQGIGPHGQCVFQAESGSRFCVMHYTASTNTALRNYRLTKWQARANEFADSEGVKSLREEIGILRILLEEIMNACHNSTDLIIQSEAISELVIKIEKLVKSCHSLEERSGMLIDKTTALRIADKIVEILGTQLSSEVVDNIAVQILSAIVNRG